MALDTAIKRGSAMLLAVPFRPWLSIPDGTIAEADRLSLVYLGASIAAGAPPEESPETSLDAAIATLPRLTATVVLCNRLSAVIACKPRLNASVQVKPT